MSAKNIPVWMSVPPLRGAPGFGPLGLYPGYDGTLRHVGGMERRS